MIVLFRNLLLVLLAVALSAGCREKISMSPLVSLEVNTMEPTLPKGAVVDVDTAAYGSIRPARWDVVAYAPPYVGGDVVFVARVVGLPGELVCVSTEGLTINGEKLVKPSSLEYVKYGPEMNDVIYSKKERHVFGLNVNEYVLLADDVEGALDSRVLGVICLDQIVGQIDLDGARESERLSEKWD